jgi:hypothetical protein
VAPGFLLLKIVFVEYWTEKIKLRDDRLFESRGWIAAAPSFFIPDCRQVK